MMRFEKEKKVFPRGEYRARWDMPHKDPMAYDRRREKKEIIEKEKLSLKINNKNVEESEENMLNEEDYIECSLEPIKEVFWDTNNSSNPKVKYGKYHGSNWSFETKKQHAIVVKIKVDYETYLNYGMTRESILQKCVSYLNRPLNGKRKPSYGKLQTTDCIPVFKDGCISVVLSTDDSNNKHFWGKGKRLDK